MEQARNGYTPYWMSFGGDGSQRKSRPSRCGLESLFGDRKTRAFDPGQYQNWYGYRDFSRGPHTNLMVHFIDLVHYVTHDHFRAGLPRSGTHTGGKAPSTCRIRWRSRWIILRLMVRYCTVFGNGRGLCQMVRHPRHAGRS